MGLILLGIAALICVLVFCVIALYDHHYLNYSLSYGFVKWLNCSHHWHDFGHFLFGFMLTTIVCILVSILTVFLASYALWLHSLIFKHPIAFSFLCLVPTMSLVLCKELIMDGHWKGFTSKVKHDAVDFFYDVFNYLMGSAVSSLLFAALFDTLF